MDIDTMPAGREMDVLVAEKVMEWRDVTLDGYPPVWEVGESLRTWEPTSFGSFMPSTEIAAAMELEPKMPYFVLRRRGPRWECQSVFCGDPMDHMVEHNGVSACACRFGEGGTPELAITRAALKAAT